MLKVSYRKSLCLIAVLVFGVSQAASAALIGLAPQDPLVSFNLTGTTSYDGAGALAVSATAFPPGGVEPISISLTLDSAGNLVGPGTLTIGGGSVLSASVVDFGFQDPPQASAVTFDLLLADATGSLVDPGGIYAASDTLGVVFTSALDPGSQFVGFDTGFDGAAVGRLGVVNTASVVPEPSAALMTAVALVFVQMRARSRRR